MGSRANELKIHTRCIRLTSESFEHKTLFLARIWRTVAHSGMSSGAVLRMLWYCAGWHLSSPKGVVRKSLAGAWRRKLRLEFLLWQLCGVHLVIPGCPQQRVCGCSGTTLAGILSTPCGVGRKVLKVFDWSLAGQDWKERVKMLWPQ